MPSELPRSAALLYGSCGPPTMGALSIDRLNAYSIWKARPCEYRLDTSTCNWLRIESAPVASRLMVDQGWYGRRGWIASPDCTLGSFNNRLYHGRWLVLLPT